LYIELGEGSVDCLQKNLLLKVLNHVSFPFDGIHFQLFHVWVRFIYWLGNHLCRHLSEQTQTQTQAQNTNTSTKHKLKQKQQQW